MIHETRLPWCRRLNASQPQIVNSKTDFSSEFARLNDAKQPHLVRVRIYERSASVRDSPDKAGPPFLRTTLVLMIDAFSLACTLFPHFHMTVSPGVPEALHLLQCTRKCPHTDRKTSFTVG